MVRKSRVNFIKKTQDKRLADIEKSLESMGAKVDRIIYLLKEHHKSISYLDDWSLRIVTDYWKTKERIKALEYDEKLIFENQRDISALIKVINNITKKQILTMKEMKDGERKHNSN